MSATTTVWPRRTSARASARPMPDAAPVMIAIRAIHTSRAHEHSRGHGPRNAERLYLLCNSFRTLPSGRRSCRMIFLLFLEEAYWQGIWLQGHLFEWPLPSAQRASRGGWGTLARVPLPVLTKTPCVPG